jgi:hypothetical protein
MATKQQFLNILKRELSKYDWAKDPARLAKAMEEATKTINGNKTCIIDGASWKTAWKEIGMKGTPTLKGLCAFPEGESI